MRQSPKCKCGCGGFVSWSESEGRYYTWLHGHHGRGIPRPAHVKEAMRKARLGKPGTPHTQEFINRLSVTRKGSGNPCWRGGVWYNFNKLRNEIIKRDGGCCVNFSCNHSTVRLNVHHIDYDKSNNTRTNLVTLCHSCHSRTNVKNRSLHKRYYSLYTIARERRCEYERRIGF